MGWWGDRHLNNFETIQKGVKQLKNETSGSPILSLGLPLVRFVRFGFYRSLLHDRGLYLLYGIGP